METVKGPDSLEEKLTELVNRYQVSLLRLCFSYLHDEELAKDAVQETFIKAYRSLPAFRGESAEQTWLYRIAVNVCKDLHKSAWFRHIDRSVSLDKIPEPSIETEPDEMGLTLAIMNLPVKLREAALLCWFQGMTYEEAAATLGISYQAVGSRLNRARKKLTSYWEGSESDELDR